jgi:hypothetical protein
MRISPVLANWILVGGKGLPVVFDREGAAVVCEWSENLEVIARLFRIER